MSQDIEKKTFLSRFRSEFSTVLRTSTVFRVGFVLLIIVFSLAIFEPALNDFRLGGHKSTEFGVYDKLLPFSIEHPFGTDHFGRDSLAIQITGLKFSLMIGLSAGGVATLIAVFMAVVAGFVGGKIDAVLNSVTNAVLVIPTLPILIAMAAYMRMNLLLISFTLAIFSWPWAARTIRAQILSLKEMGYVELAEMTGLNKFEIMFTEILPNLIPFIGVGFSYATIGAILAETGLRVIGLGPAEIPSLGMLLNWAMTFGVLAQGYYILVIGPAAFLILIFISFNLVNTGVEEVFNPRLKKITGI